LLCAGGGRMFLEDDEGGRINEERTKEALATEPIQSLQLAHFV